VNGSDVILKTERLIIRKLDSEADAEFICELLNTPKFIQHIGDRGVRTVDDASNVIQSRYRKSYEDHGYGLYTVELRHLTVPVGICGFVRRDTLPGPDIGFAFLPEHERQGYGYESAAAMMQYGQEMLGFERVYAITSLQNDASLGLLEKLGFKFESLTDSPDGEPLRLFSYRY
jgi:[ribosomal protein S5]-alanine N-acetyltransferase